MLGVATLRFFLCILFVLLKVLIVALNLEKGSNKNILFATSLKGEKNMSNLVIKGFGTKRYHSNIDSYLEQPVTSQFIKEK